MAKNNRTRVISFRVDVPTYIDALTNAEKENITINEFCVKALKPKPKPKPPTAELNKLKKEVSKYEAEVVELKKVLKKASKELDFLIDYSVNIKGGDVATTAETVETRLKKLLKTTNVY